MIANEKRKCNGSDNHQQEVLLVLPVPALDMEWIRFEKTMRFHAVYAVNVEPETVNVQLPQAVIVIAISCPNHATGHTANYMSSKKCGDSQGLTGNAQYVGIAQQTCDAASPSHASNACAVRPGLNCRTLSPPSSPTCELSNKFGRLRPSRSSAELPASQQGATGNRSKTGAWWRPTRSSPEPTGTR